jgi:biopolymer transport protein ExbB
MTLEMLLGSGPVLWVIVAGGAVAFGVFVERSLHLHRARIRWDDFLKGVCNILRRQSIPEALAICSETPGPVAHVVKTAILHREAGREAIESAVRSATLVEVSRMERRLVVVSSVAQLAPLMGLLGTILSMLDSLLAIQRDAPLVQMGDVTGGLMQALVTTAAGLMVAIPCYAAFNLLLVKIDRLVLDMEQAGSEIVAFLTTSSPVNSEKDSRNVLQTTTA